MSSLKSLGLRIFSWSCSLLHVIIIISQEVLRKLLLVACACCRSFDSVCQLVILCCRLHLLPAGASLLQGKHTPGPPRGPLNI